MHLLISPRRQHSAAIASVLASVVVLLLSSPLPGETTSVRSSAAAAVEAQAEGDAANASAPSSASEGQFRRLAPGVLTTIPPSLEEQDTVSSHPIVELLAMKDRLNWSPQSVVVQDTLTNLASDAEFRHTVWGLEFSFKPLRMIWVDVPQKDGGMERRLVWYLIYRVRNVGGHLNPVRLEDGTFALERVNDVGEPIRFIPKFELYSHEYKKCYLDEVIPTAIGPIQRREDPNRELLNSVQMASTEIPLSTEEVDRGVWGVATWGGYTEIDPRIDFFSLYVQGLTNAYRWDDPPGAYQAGAEPGAGRRFTRKTLELNFWRPGDELEPHEREFRFGVPPEKEKHYGLESARDYRWLYLSGCKA